LVFLKDKKSPGKQDTATPCGERVRLRKAVVENADCVGGGYKSGRDARIILFRRQAALRVRSLPNKSGPSHGKFGPLASTVFQAGPGTDFP